MTKDEVYELLCSSGRLTVRFEWGVLNYVDGGELFYDGKFHNRRNVFGVFHDIEGGSYDFVVTNDERDGMIVYHREFASEDDAYEQLYAFVSGAERMFGL